MLLLPILNIVYYYTKQLLAVLLEELYDFIKYMYCIICIVLYVLCYLRKN